MSPSVYNEYVFKISLWYRVAFINPTQGCELKIVKRLSDHSLLISAKQRESMHIYMSNHTQGPQFPRPLFMTSHYVTYGVYLK